jgi:DNA-binding MarR family transcriptional regulator
MANENQALTREVDDIAENCLAVRTRLLNRVITHIYDEALRPLGLKVSQMNILVVVHKLGRARPADVCQVMKLDTSTLSRNVDRMRAKGWLEVLDDRDGRAHPIQLTAEGMSLIRRAYPAWKEAQDTSAAILGEAGVGLLHDLSKEMGFTR